MASTLNTHKVTTSVACKMALTAYPLTSQDLTDWDTNPPPCKWTTSPGLGGHTVTRRFAKVPEIF